MKISYREDTDSLYLRLNNEEPDDSFEMSADLILHMDYWGNFCAMEWIQYASKQVDLSRLDVEGIPDGPGRRADLCVSQEARGRGGMRISYDKASDSSSLIIMRKESEASFDFEDGVWLHTDEWHNICGIEWTNDASKKVDLSRLEVEGILEEPGRGGSGGEGAA